jgi:hypothetical protein
VMKSTPSPKAERVSGHGIFNSLNRMIGDSQRP